ncbi:uncharacterized protein LOC130232288 [Danio aesculapii]|uniref:uncharacterized protein LOC130232288 n=1 Tax=Danio aesculapii TaxID=1142201 RepID=UPI0024BFC6F8|nr:uncharacterized protein LOC130232288 [Danio aesculapii]XP_056318079.1 uncharacterized protein LOC130232288 [Danio aesculapii]
MSRRCVLGCGSPETLFIFPKTPWLRSRWLAFLHFEEGAISESSRLCSKHFTQESFKNWTRHKMGYVKFLSLTENAVPTVYTVGASQTLKPLTRDVACQCDPPTMKSVSVRTEKQKQKIRSKGVQVKPCWLQPVGTSCSDANSAPSCFTSIPIKRPRMEVSTISENSVSTSKHLSDFCEPDVKEEDIKKSVQTAYVNEWKSEPDT